MAAASSGGLVIAEDDLSSTQTRDLLAYHLAQMHAHSPPGSVFALDLSGLQAPGVTTWSVWSGDEIAGVGALKRLGGGDDGGGEIKSMRTHPGHLRRGVAAALLKHIVERSRHDGLHRLSLETGSGAAFEPALALYRRHGFRSGPAFSDYEQSPFNQFMHLTLA